MNVGEWASDHKPVIIGGAAGLVLLLLYLRHRANAGQSTAGQGGITGATTDTGSYTVPVDSGSVDPTGGTDNTALLDAITGLTTSINNLDPATGPTNNGTDNAGGSDIHLNGTPIWAKPQPVHQAKKTTPVRATVHRTPPHKMTGHKAPKAPTRKKQEPAKRQRRRERFVPRPVPVRR